MKTKLIIAAIIVAVILCVLAYFNFVPFWVAITTTAAFVIGVLAGWFGKKWADKHVN